MADAGFLAARIQTSANGILWVEYRVRQSADLHLGATVPGVTALQGNYYETLLVKQALGTNLEATSLLAIIPVGASATVYGVVVTHTAAGVCSVGFPATTEASTTVSTTTAAATADATTTAPTTAAATSPPTQTWTLNISPFTAAADALTWTNNDAVSLTSAQDVARAWLATHAPYSGNVQGYLPSLLSLMESTMQAR
jgi:hypothetical protein